MGENENEGGSKGGRAGARAHSRDDDRDDNVMIASSSSRRRVSDGETED